MSVAEVKGKSERFVLLVQPGGAKVPHALGNVNATGSSEKGEHWPILALTLSLIDACRANPSQYAVEYNVRSHLLHFNLVILNKIIAKFESRSSSSFTTIYQWFGTL